MKNMIKYYYGLDIDTIIEKDNNYKLIIDGANYLLSRCNKIDLLNILKYIDKYNFHTIVNTIGNDITIPINSYDYVLLKLKKTYKKISIEDIYDFNFPLYIKNDSINRWISLWSSHIDYIEYQMNELSNKYPILAKYVYYYIGLTETAIEFLKTIDNNSYEYIAHRRINSDMTLVDLYNPVNLVIDSKVRDISEYYKNMFFNNDDPNIINEIKESIRYFNESELKLFLARMLYPTYFFDIYDDILEHDLSDDRLYNIINKSDEYEILLKELYMSIKKATPIENIEWLIQLR